MSAKEILQKVLHVENLSTLWIIFACILIVWLTIAIPLFVFHKIAPAYFGTLGDTYGIINSLFSSFAFAGLLYTIFLQKRELKESRETISIARFEQTYFELLKFRKEVVSKITQRIGVLNGQPMEYVGDTFFEAVNQDLIKELVNANYDDEIASDRGFFKVFVTYNSLALYIDNVYLILKYIDETKLPIDKQLFYSLFANQLSSNEVNLLLYFVLYGKGIKKHDVLSDMIVKNRAIPLNQFKSIRDADFLRMISLYTT